MKVFNEQLRNPAKTCFLLPLADAVDAADFGGTFHLSRMDRKTLPVHRESAKFVTCRRFSLLIRPRVAEALVSLVQNTTYLAKLLSLVDC